MKFFKVIYSLICLIFFNSGIMAGSTQLIKVEKEIEVERPDLAFKCIFQKAPSYVWTTANINPYFVPEEISSNFRNNGKIGFSWSVPAGTKCDSIENAIEENIRENNGKLIANAVRLVSLKSMPNTNGSSLCKLYLIERVTLTVNRFTFNNQKIVFIKDLENLNFKDCRSFRPTGIF